MADMALCEGDECPMKQQCKRWDKITPPDPSYQTYILGTPWKMTIKTKKFSCSKFIQNITVNTFHVPKENISEFCEKGLNDVLKQKRDESF
jgi:hypothetical protein